MRIRHTDAFSWHHTHLAADRSKLPIAVFLITYFPDSSPMFTKANAEAYFNAEKAESLLFLIIGAIAILAGLILFFAGKSDFNKGFAIPVFLVAIVQCIVGYTVYSRSDKQRQAIVYQMDMNPYSLEEKELPRMEKVMQQFKNYRYIEIFLLMAGLGLYLFLREKDNLQLLSGVGMGLALQACLMLAADGFAEYRGNSYLRGMRWFVQEKVTMK